VLQVCPHIFVVGDQPQFETTVIEGPQNQSVRLITVPSFRDTGLVILLDSETLEVDCIKFDVFGKDTKTALDLGETQNGQSSG
jgi:DNA polymerase delta subunit 2